MADASLQIGNGNWGVKTSLLLGYNVVSNRYNPIEIGVTRETLGSRTNEAGIIDYKNNNIARINYASGVGSLLLEPQRMNLALQSEDFSAANWVPTTATITTNTDISPSGVQNADRLTANLAFSQIQSTSIVAIGSTYTVSFWIKRISGTGQVNIRAIENVNTPITITNQWARYSVTATASSTVGRIGVNLITSGDVVAIWGAQLEQGAYATSYIPTTTSAITRNADTISINNIYTNNLITSDGGTWFIEINNNIPLIRDASSNLFIGTTSNGNTNTSFGIRSSTSASAKLTLYKRELGTITASTPITTENAKVLVKWNNSTADFFINGAKVVANIPHTATMMDFFMGDGKDSPKYIKSTMLFPTPLTDTECINLTTL